MSLPKVICNEYCSNCSSRVYCSLQCSDSRHCWRGSTKDIWL